MRYINMIQSEQVHVQSLRADNSESLKDLDHIRDMLTKDLHKSRSASRPLNF